MIENLPNYIAIIFALITLATFILFFMAIKKSIASPKATIIQAKRIKSSTIL
jgi:hypothetical protein